MSVGLLRRRCAVVAAVLAGLFALPSMPHAAAALRTATAVSGCPVTNATLFEPDAEHSSGGVGASCNYAVKENGRVVGGFAAVLEQRCAADIAARFAAFPRTNRRVTATEILATEKRDPGAFTSFTGAWSTQEKAFLLVSPTAIVTVTAYSDLGLYDRDGLAAVAAAVAAANPAPTLPCDAGPTAGATSTSSTTSSTTSTTAAKALTMTAGFGDGDWVQNLLDRIPLRVQVSAGGVAVAGASVTVEFEGAVEAQGTTGADGTIVLEHRFTTYGRVSVALLIRASKDGYASAAGVLKNEFFLNRLGTQVVLDPVNGSRQRGEQVTISGTVTSTLGGLRLNRGVSSAVKIEGFSGDASGTTDADGRFSIAVPAAAEVKVQATPRDADRYAPSSASLFLDVVAPKTPVVTAYADRDIYDTGDVVTVSGSALVDGQAFAGIVNAGYTSRGNAVALPPFAVDRNGDFRFSLPPLPALEALSRTLVRVTVSGVGLNPTTVLVFVRQRSELEACRPLAATVVSGSPTFLPVGSDNATLPATILGATLAQGLRPGTTLADRSQLSSPGSFVISFPIPATVPTNSPAPSPSGSTLAAIAVAPGSTIKVLRYCIDPSGKTIVVIEASDRSAVRVHVDSAGPANVSFSVVTAAATVNDVHTDYLVATDGARAYVTLLEGAIAVTTANGAPSPFSGKQALTIAQPGAPVEARALPADATPALADPLPSAAAMPAALTFKPVATPAPTTTAAPGIPSTVSSSTVAGPVTVSSTPASPSAPVPFPFRPGIPTSLRACFDASQLAAQKGAAAIQQRVFTVRAAVVKPKAPKPVKGRTTTTVAAATAIPSTWRLSVVGYPGGLTIEGVWNGTGLRVTRWWAGAAYSAARPHGTAALAYDGSTKTLAGPWSSVKGGGGRWSVVATAAPPAC